MQYNEICEDEIEGALIHRCMNSNHWGRPDETDWSRSVNVEVGSPLMIMCAAFKAHASAGKRRPLQWSCSAAGVGTFGSFAIMPCDFVAYDPKGFDLGPFTPVHP